MEQVFQEKHTRGHLWWKRTYYVYYRYWGGAMVAVPIYSNETVKQLEKGK